VVFEFAFHFALSLSSPTLSLLAAKQPRPVFSRLTGCCCPDFPCSFLSTVSQVVNGALTLFSLSAFFFLTTSSFSKGGWSCTLKGYFCSPPNCYHLSISSTRHPPFIFFPFCLSLQNLDLLFFLLSVDTSNIKSLPNIIPPVLIRIHNLVIMAILRFCSTWLVSTQLRRTLHESLFVPFPPVLYPSPPGLHFSLHLSRGPPVHQHVFPFHGPWTSPASARSGFSPQDPREVMLLLHLVEEYHLYTFISLPLLSILFFFSETSSFFRAFENFTRPGGFFFLGGGWVGGGFVLVFGVFFSVGVWWGAILGPLGGWGFVFFWACFFWGGFWSGGVFLFWAGWVGGGGGLDPKKKNPHPTPPPKKTKKTKTQPHKKNKPPKPKQTPNKKPPPTPQKKKPPKKTTKNNQPPPPPPPKPPPPTNPTPQPPKPHQQNKKTPPPHPQTQTTPPNKPPTPTPHPPPTKNPTPQPQNKTPKQNTQPHQPNKPPHTNPPKPKQKKTKTKKPKNPKKPPKTPTAFPLLLSLRYPFCGGRSLVWPPFNRGRLPVISLIDSSAFLF